MKKEAAVRVSRRGRGKLDPWLSRFLTPPLGGTGKIYYLPLASYKGAGCSCAPGCRQNWLRKWSRKGQQVTQLEELGGRKEMRRLKVTPPETLQTK